MKRISIKIHSCKQCCEMFGVHKLCLSSFINLNDTLIDPECPLHKWNEDESVIKNNRMFKIKNKNKNKIFLRLIICCNCKHFKVCPNLELGECNFDNITNIVYYNSRCIYGLSETVKIP